MTTSEIPIDVATSFQNLKRASRILRQLETETKNKFLLALSRNLESASKQVLSANQVDLARLPAETAAHFRDRLKLDGSRLAAICKSLDAVAQLPDPIGEELEDRVLENDLRLRRVRAPLGVILMIFESRPNVILEAFSLAFKSGNAIALRGGSESADSARAIYQVIRQTLCEFHLPETLFYGFYDYDRGLVEALLQRKDWIDVAIPRGGDRLIEFVQNTAKMPIIKNDRGLCHAYVDREADLDMAVRVVSNAKISRPGVCNSLETVLVDASVAAVFLPKLYDSTSAVKLQWRCDSGSLAILKNRSQVTAATAADWDTEHLDLILNCRIVKDLAEAMDHIERHGSKHSEVIITRNEKTARHFQAEVDAAAVYWNASTRFTDGFEFGLGGEIGISTQKIHVRGPVGLRELTTPRWVIDGTGQIR